MIYTIDAADSPATITGVVTVTGGAYGEAGHDLEGIAVAPEGGFWLASEGRPTDGRRNLLIRVGADGAVMEEVTLPDGVEDGARDNGYEGVAIGPVGGETRVVAAIQRDWEGDPEDHAKLAVFDPESDDWGFVHYPMDAPSSPRGGWVGLSEIVHVGDGRFALIERDNQPGGHSTFKAVTVVDLSAVTPAPAGDTPPVVAKTTAIDLLPLLRDTNGWIGDKPEGLALAADGTLWLVTDNDGVDDASGETRFRTIGTAGDL